MKQSIIILLFTLFFLSLHREAEAQTNADSVLYMEAYVEGSDTILYVELEEIFVVPEKKFRSRRMKRKYYRMVRRVRKVYPLAVEAKVLLEKYEPVYVQLETKRDKRRLMRKLEKELFAKHKKELKKWSITDGRVLLKLINRETDRSAYKLIREFRGGFSAAFWQTIAKIFRNDLKAGYDPEHDDKMIEEIVVRIEKGYL